MEKKKKKRAARMCSWHCKCGCSLSCMLLQQWCNLHVKLFWSLLYFPFRLTLSLFLFFFFLVSVLRTQRWQCVNPKERIIHWRAFTPNRIGKQKHERDLCSVAGKLQSQRENQKYKRSSITIINWRAPERENNHKASKHIKHNKKGII